VSGLARENTRQRYCGRGEPVRLWAGTRQPGGASCGTPGPQTMPLPATRGARPMPRRPAWREELPPGARPGTAPECTATRHALSPQASPPGAAPGTRDGRVRALPQGLRRSPPGPPGRACRAGQETGPAGQAVARTHNRPVHITGPVGVARPAAVVAPVMTGAVIARHAQPPLSSPRQCPGREAPSRRPGPAKLCLPVMVPPIVFVTQLPLASPLAGKTLPCRHRW
jgi:hypothetical protein